MKRRSKNLMVEDVVKKIEAQHPWFAALPEKVRFVTCGMILHKWFRTDTDLCLTFLDRVEEYREQPIKSLNQLVAYLHRCAKNPDTIHDARKHVEMSQRYENANRDLTDKEFKRLGDIMAAAKKGSERC